MDKNSKQTENQQKRQKDNGRTIQFSRNLLKSKLRPHSYS